MLDWEIKGNLWGVTRLYLLRGGQVQSLSLSYMRVVSFLDHIFDQKGEGHKIWSFSIIYLDPSLTINLLEFETKIVFLLWGCP